MDKHTTMNKVAELSILLSGSVHLKRKTQKVKKKGTSLRLQVDYERGGPRIEYAPYEGRDHYVEVEPSVASRVSPIYEETWNYWLETIPSRHALKQMFPGTKSRNEAIVKFHGSPDYLKVVGHCYDIVADATGKKAPRVGVDFKLEMYFI